MARSIFAAVGIVIRQSVKSTVVTMAGAVLGALVIIFSTRLMPQQELGFSRILSTFAIVAGSLLVMGFHATIAVYIYRYPVGDPRRPALLGLSFALPFGAVTVLSGVYFLFKTKFIGLFQPQDIPFFNRYFLWLPVFVLLSAFHVLLESYLMAQMKVAISVAVREIGLKGGNLLLIVLFGLGWISFSGFIAASVLLYGAACAVLLLLIRRNAGFGISLRWKVFSRPEIREILHFAGFHALLGVSLNLLVWLDGIMLAPLDRAGLRATAVYTVAIFVISIMQIPMRALSAAVAPVLTQAYQAAETGKVTDVFRRSSQNMLLATAGMSLVILANLSNGLQLLGPGFDAILYIVPVLVIGRIVDAATGVNDHVLSISRHYRFSFLLSLGLVAGMVGLNLLLIPRFGVMGAAWSTTSSLLLYNLGKWYFVQRHLGLQPLSAITVRILLAAGLTFGASLLLPRLQPMLLDALVRTLLISLLFPALLLAFKAAPDLILFLQAIRRRLTARKA